MMSRDSDVQTDEGPTEPAVDEVFCTSCGETIKEQAEICPECGVRQLKPDAAPRSGAAESSLPNDKVDELQTLAQKSPGRAIALGVLLSAGAYFYVGRPKLAVLNIVTFNFILTGFILVPIHTYKMIDDARDELERHGKDW